MRIDKVVFSASEPFANEFWNINSKVWRTKLNVEPVCLLFGDKSNLSETYGRVIQMPLLKRPPIIQITWSKFWWVTTEPETTWLIGDIDLIPLSTHWFTDNIMSVPDDAYVHLDADGITQLAETPRWCERAPGEVVEDVGCPSNLPGHYHCGKGRVLDIGLERGESFEAEIAHIVDSKKYGNMRDFRPDDPIEQYDLWCAEELRSTKAIRRQIQEKRISFIPFSLRHGIERETGDRLDRTRYIDGRYRCDEARLKAGEYVDLHCARPFKHVSEDERERIRKANEDVLTKAGML